jgi:hypothetical protein
VLPTEKDAAHACWHIAKDLRKIREYLSDTVASPGVVTAAGHSVVTVRLRSLPVIDRAPWPVVRKSRCDRSGCVLFPSETRAVAATSVRN